MNPSTGQFLSKDRYEGDTSNPITLHKYLYAHANPVTYEDPSGYFAQLAATAAMRSKLDIQAVGAGLLVLKMAKSLAASAAASVAVTAVFYQRLVDIADGVSTGVALSSMYDEAIKAAKSSDNGTTKKAEKGSSRKLRKNMNNRGIKPPPFKNAAHHIVAAAAKAAEEGRKILRDHGISINDAVNGVFLPVKEGVSKAANHARLHTDIYYKAVNKALEEAKEGKDVVRILGEIAEALQNGTFPH